MILKETIDEIFLISDIVDVIGEFINLKKVGNNYKGLSPFSNERIPSLVVSPSKKIWKDFSSGKGGNIITFLMEYEKLSYPESLYWLANRYNINIKKDKYNIKNINIFYQKKNIYKIQKIAKNFYNEQLFNFKEGINIGLIYLKKRKIKKDIIKKFELGYASNKWTSFINFAIKNGLNYNELQNSGLIINNNNNKYDRYRNSIIFPIKNINGITIGFGGRFLYKKLNNKYINSPESLIYYKSKNLYGIYEAKKYIIKYNFCYLVEGYTDVLSLYQTGIKNIVATLGTSLSKDQIFLIKKLTNNIIILFDGDLAGIKASLKIIDILLEYDMNIKIVNIYNEDPNSICYKYEHNYIKVNKFIKNNILNFIEFKINIFYKNNKEDIIKKEKLIQNIIKSISIISNNIKKELYIQELSNSLNINKLFIYKELSIYQNNILIKRNNQQKKIIYNIIDPLILSEETIIKFILYHGDKIIEYKKLDNKKNIKITVIEQILYQFNIDNMKFTLIFYQNIFNKISEEFNKNKIIPKINVLFSPILEDIYLENKKNILEKGINIKIYLNEILLRHRSHYLSNIIDFFIKKSKYNTNENISKIKEKIIFLTKEKILINKKLNRYV